MVDLENYCKTYESAMKLFPVATWQRKADICFIVWVILPNNLLWAQEDEK